MLAGDILRSIKNAWGEESVGGRADFILRGILQGLLATPGTNLVDAYSLLSDKDALRRFVTRIPGGPLRQFLEVHLPSLNYTFTMSSLDKVGKIATNPMLRKALCQRAHPVSFDQLLRHRLLLLNLCKGSLGAEGSQFLGAIFLTQLWAALPRSGSTDHPVYLVVDELHNYAVPAFGEMLNEGAKFGLHVIAATQYPSPHSRRDSAGVAGQRCALAAVLAGSGGHGDGLEDGRRTTPWMDPAGSRERSAAPRDRPPSPGHVGEGEYTPASAVEPGVGACRITPHTEHPQVRRAGGLRRRRLCSLPPMRSRSFCARCLQVPRVVRSWRPGPPCHRNDARQSWPAVVRQVICPRTQRRRCGR